MGIVAIIVFCITESVKQGTLATISTGDPQKMIYSTSKEQLILEKILKNYDQRVRPPPTNTSGIIKYLVIASTVIYISGTIVLNNFFHFKQVNDK